MDEEKENKVQGAKKEANKIGKRGKKGSTNAFVAQIKKFIKRKLIKTAIIVSLLILPIFLAAMSAWSVYDSMKNLTLTNMGPTLANADSTTNSSIVKIFSGVGKIVKKLFGGETEEAPSTPYWINLGKKSKFILDKDTGENLAYIDEEAEQKLLLSRTALIKMLKEYDPDKKVEDVTQNELADYTEKFLASDLVNPTDEDDAKEYTLVDNYIKELGNQGVSLKELRLLGEADYEDINQILDDEKTRKLVEKYIAEFLRADIITQQPHRTEGDDIVFDKNPNYVDGGIFLWRNKVPEILSDKRLDELKGSPPPTVLGDGEFERLKYIPPEKFLVEVGYEQSEEQAKEDLRANKFKDLIIKLSGNKDGELGPFDDINIGLLYYFTQDPDTDEIVIIKYRTEEKAVDTWENYEPLENISITQESAEKNVYISPAYLDYKEKIAKYIMPYEFLINLCQITQNPEFVYHVAMLARKTYIALRIQDDYAVRRETIDQKIQELVTEDSVDPETNATTTTSYWVTSYPREVQTTRVYTPTLQLRFAETWSWFESFEYLKYIHMRRQCRR